MGEPVRVPPSPTAQSNQGSTYSPHELNPDLAQAKMAEDIIKMMGSPSIISTPFVVRYGIFSGLNHTTDNPTGYDCRMRLAIYENVAHQSPNVNGAYFEKVWQYLMKPKMIVQGMPGTQAFQEEEKESLWDRTIGRFFGGKKNDTTNNNS